MSNKKGGIFFFFFLRVVNFVFSSPDRCFPCCLSVVHVWKVSTMELDFHPWPPDVVHKLDLIGKFTSCFLFSNLISIFLLFFLFLSFFLFFYFSSTMFDFYPYPPGFIHTPRVFLSGGLFCYFWVERATWTKWFSGLSFI